MRKRIILSSLLLIASAGLIIWGCTDSPTGFGGGQVLFDIDVESPKLLQQQPIDSLWARLTVTAPDMDSIVVPSVRVQPDGTFEMQVDVPVGRSRKFVLELFKEVAPQIAAQVVGARLIYYGETTATVFPSRATRVAITLTPQVPMLKLTPMVTRATAGERFDLHLIAYNMPGLTYVSTDIYFDGGFWNITQISGEPAIPPAWLPSSAEFKGEEIEGYSLLINDTLGEPFPLSRGGTLLATIPFRSQAYTEVDSGQLLIPISWNPSWQSDSLLDQVFVEQSQLILDPVLDMEFTLPDSVFQIAASISVYGYQDSVIKLSDALDQYSLQVMEWPIEDITGIEHFANLGYLQLGYNLFSDIRPLAGLRFMNNLTVVSNHLVDISALAGMSWLGYLDLHTNDIRDISPLRNLSRLYTLNFADNEIVDISALRNLPRIYDVNLSHNLVTDLTPLVENADFGAYSTLNIEGNPVVDTQVGQFQIGQLRQKGVTVITGPA